MCSGQEYVHRLEDMADRPLCDIATALYAQLPARVHIAGHRRCTRRLAERALACWHPRPSLRRRLTGQGWLTKGLASETMWSASSSVMKL